MTRLLSLVLLAVVLAACNTTHWVRPDTAPEQADQDDMDCQRWAAREVSAMAAGFYGPGYYGPGYYGPYGYGLYHRGITRPDAGVPDAYGYRVRDEAGLHNLCMRAKGYQYQ